MNIYFCYLSEYINNKILNKWPESLQVDHSFTSSYLPGIPCMMALDIHEYTSHHMVHKSYMAPAYVRTCMISHKAGDAMWEIVDIVDLVRPCLVM